MKKIGGRLKIEPIEARPSRATPVIGTVSAEGYVDGPASEVDADASYTFEGKVDGRWYRWTGQRPTINGDRARFWLRDGTPIVTPRN